MPKPIRSIKTPSRPAISGFTLLETLLAAAVAGIVILAIVQLFSPVLKFFQRSQVRQVAHREARICVDMIKQVMTNGRVSTLVITAAPTTPPVPLSQAQFYTEDGTFYTIALSMSPANSVHLVKTASGGTVTDTILATHVTELVFTLDMNDPGIVHVTLGTAYLLDSAGTPSSVYTTLLDKQTILMHAS